MRKILIFFFCFTFSLFLVFIARDFYLKQSHKVDVPKTQEQKKPTFKIWQLGLNDKYGFFDTAILENGKVWAVGYDGHDPRRIYYSNDQGRNWGFKTFPEFIMLHRLQFIDNQNGWASGNNQILRTNDGGETWTLAKLKTNVEFDSLNFYNEKIGYVGGGGMFRKCRGCKIEILPAEIWKTIDGGESWKRIFKSAKYYNVFDVLTVSENTAVAIVDAKTIIRTEDGGKNWKEIITFENVQDLALMPNGRIWTDGDKGNFYYSDDEGLTWKRPANFPTQFLDYDWNDIKFADSERGIAVGRNGKVAITKDGGNSWEEVNAEIPQYVNESDKLIWVSFKGENGIIIGGGYNYVFNFPKN